MEGEGGSRRRMLNDLGIGSMWRGWRDVMLGFCGRVRKIMTKH